MSMLMQFFVCDQTQIRAWVSALLDYDGAAQQSGEEGMARCMTLKNLSDTDVRLLACCTPGFQDDGGTNRVATVDEAQGRFVMEFKRPLVSSIAETELTSPIIDEWIDRAGTLTSDPLHRARYLTTHTAACLQDLCRTALHEELGFYCCYFGRCGTKRGHFKEYTPSVSAG